MGRNERFTLPFEIKKHFKVFDEKSKTAGPVVYYENGRKHYDDSEAHIAVIGRTGKGKSQVGSLPFIRNCIMAGESLIVLDPKGECYRKTACYAEKSHDIRCVDFRQPRLSPTKWNPLNAIKKLYRSKNPDDRDKASSMLSEMSDDIYPRSINEDYFWPDSAAEFFRGITYALLDIADDDEINIDSISSIIEVAENKIGMSTYIKEFANQLPEKSLTRRHLETYISAPNDTRGSIHAVASSGLRIFSQSRGLMNMISQDTLNVNELDLDKKPLAIYIILPDETNTYDALAGLLVLQLTEHFIDLAQSKYNGRLPHKLNIVLEELGSVGKAINTLPNLMTAARSRNIRLMLILQSNSQLEDIYGKSNAETINASIGITYGFSTNSWETLKEWEQRCGEREIEYNGNLVREPLITASQLAAMPICTALVMIDNRYKYVAHFPFYDEMYDNSDWREPRKYQTDNCNEVKSFDLIAYINRAKDEKRKTLFGNNSNPFKHQNNTPPSSDESTSYMVDELDLDSMMKKIDERLAEAEIDCDD